MIRTIAAVGLTVDEEVQRKTWFSNKNLAHRRQKCTNLIEIVSSLFQILINQSE